MKKVVLRGELGKKFGRVHWFELSTPGEAIRALCANFQGFQQELYEAGERGIGYMVQIGRDAMETLDHLEFPSGQQESISITPVLQGAGGGGVGKIFAGIALVAAAIVLGPVGAVIGGVGAGILGATAATAVGYIGAAMILGGTAQLLSPNISDSPGTFGATSPSRARARESFSSETNEVADNRASYIYNGAVNLTAQGNPVPILYGRMKTGSVVISAGLSVEDIDG
tara:strand:- start:1070 stop:1750 length:681 start_codon:yes stop_codon:yes gene_type:complete